MRSLLFGVVCVATAMTGCAQPDRTWDEPFGTYGGYRLTNSVYQDPAPQTQLDNFNDMATQKDEYEHDKK